MSEYFLSSGNSLHHDLLLALIEEPPSGLSTSRRRSNTMSYQSVQEVVDNWGTISLLDKWLTYTRQSPKEQMNGTIQDKGKD
jgi:hypothetical protein